MDLKENISLEKLRKFANNLLITWRSDIKNIEESYTYESVINEAENVIRILDKFDIISQKVAIQLSHSPTLISVILGILDSHHAFCPISIEKNDEDTKQSLVLYNATYLLSEKSLQVSSDFNLLQTTRMYNENIFLYKYDKTKNDQFMANLCYSIQTSGTTGEPKIVNCPYECISPNISSLSKTFCLTESDVIFVSSPPTFDPFVVDIFLAFTNGASLLLTSQRDHLSSSHLYKVLFPEEGVGATFIQMTPSNFNRLRDNTSIFDERNTLKTIVLGGEPFPDNNEVKTWQDWKSTRCKRLFNIYGITEVSCWSTLEEVSDLSSTVSLGVPIDNSTLLKVKDNERNVDITEGVGDLFIGSKERICLIDNEDVEVLHPSEPVFRATGDIVEITSSRIYYKGRTNEVIKRYGHRISLRRISDVIRTHTQVKDVCSVFDESNHVLVCFVVAMTQLTSEIIFNFLKSRIFNYEMPDKIIFCDSFPLSCHGKVSKSKLLEMHKISVLTSKSEENVLEVFKKNLIQRAIQWETDSNSTSPHQKKRKRIWDCSFIEVGGSSLQALQIVNELEISTGRKFPELLTMLMDENVPLSTILHDVQMKNILPNPSIVDTSKSEPRELLKFNIKWKYDLKKCVDASPSLLRSPDNKNIVSVGSHSSLLVNICSANGSEISSVRLPDRIEGQVAFIDNNFAVVGCYDGFLYKFNLKDGCIVWKFNSDGMIKCKPCIANDSIIFGNYSKFKNLFSLNPSTGLANWSLKLSERGILSSPVQFNHDSIIVCTLEGICAKLNVDNGNIEFKVCFASPIFSTCKIIKHSRILAAEVSGLFHVLDEHGQEIQSIKFDGNIFSSFEILSERNEVFFGCYDHNIYCLEMDNDHQFRVKWQSKQDSQIYATPKLYPLKEWIIVCTTNGCVNLLQCSSGLKLASFKLSGEIFSTPVVYDSNLIVGCRDNYLYCVEINDKA